MNKIIKDVVFILFGIFLAFNPSMVESKFSYGAPWHLLITIFS